MIWTISTTVVADIAQQELYVSLWWTYIVIIFIHWLSPTIDTNLGALLQTATACACVPTPSSQDGMACSEDATLDLPCCPCECCRDHRLWRCFRSWSCHLC